MDIGILFDLLILVIVGGLFYWIVTLLPLPDPFKTIAIVIVLVILLIALLSMLMGGGGIIHGSLLRR